MHTIHQRSNRRGSVYLAVLGTAMIAGVLAFSALALQRVQNRMLSASSDVRQAQLNAEAAIEMGVLAIKNDPNWRTTYANGNWFTNRNLSDGMSTLSVVDIDPTDGNLADDTTDSIVLTGVGTAGSAVQRVVKTVDAYTEPLECLQSSIAAGGDVSLSGSILRASNAGLITANSTSISGSTIDGRVEALTVSGATYSGTTTQVLAAERPTMPNWSTVFDYYRNNGTEIPLGSLPTSTNNLGRNTGFEEAPTVPMPVPSWTGEPPGIPTAEISRSGNWRNSGTYSSRVRNRTAPTAGCALRIDSFVKPGQQYYAEVRVNVAALIGVRSFRINLYTKGTGDPIATATPGPVGTVLSAVGIGIPVRIMGNVTAPAWNGDLEYAFVNIASSDGNNGEFYIDDFIIRETTTGRFIYRRVLGPYVNTLGTGANPQGLYWINCNNNKIVIERSRIKGTLVLVNPGAGSMIGPGPIHWSPATPGYPALLVDADNAENADFTIAATSRSLSEADDGVNYNPVGMAYDFNESDEVPADDDPANDPYDDTYPSEVQGLVLVEDDLTFQNNSLVRGSIIVGGNVANVFGSSGSLEVVYRPDSLYSPPPGLTGTAKHIGRPLSVRKAVMP